MIEKIPDWLVLVAIPILICLIVFVNGGGKQHIDAESGPSTIPGVPMKAIASCQVLFVMLIAMAVGLVIFIVGKLALP